MTCASRHARGGALLSVPIALAEAQARGMLADDATVLLAAFGGGLTWAAAVAEWGIDDGT